MSLVEELKSKTVFELKSHAKKNSIDIYGVSKRLDILEIILNFVPKEGEELVTTSPEPTVKKKTVALFSERNLNWPGVGELKNGYNIVSKEDSEKWTTQKVVRIATSEEVAAHYGK